MYLDLIVWFKFTGICGGTRFFCRFALPLREYLIFFVWLTTTNGIESILKSGALSNVRFYPSKVESGLILIAPLSFISSVFVLFLTYQKVGV